jgi:hypothetical protein
MARPAVFLNCKTCNILFKRKSKKNIFCSFGCSSVGKRYVQARFAKKIIVNCDFCTNSLEKWPCFIKKNINKKHYCNSLCRKLAMQKGETTYGFKETTGSPLNPYRRCTKNGKFVYEHRWIMEQKIGRKLTRNEHVHHINGNPKDNRIENLEILSKSDHAKTHFGKK